MKLEVLGVDDWPMIRESPGDSERHYPSTETSYIARGGGHIHVKDEEPQGFSAGDLITVLPDTLCVWYITEAIERYYSKG